MTNVFQLIQKEYLKSVAKVFVTNTYLFTYIFSDTLNGCLLLTSSCHCCVNNKQRFLLKKIKFQLRFCNKERPYDMKMFVKELLNKSWSQSPLNKLLKKIDQCFCVEMLYLQLHNLNVNNM